jgi:uncharacterized protein (DUF2267 family)
MAHPLDVENASELHIEWCLELAQLLGVNTTHQSGPQMRAVMHEVRSCMDHRCVLLFANALPALERGIFLEGWSLDEPVRRLADAGEFRERVYRRVSGHHARIDDLVEIVFGFWHDKLGGKSAQIRNCLPAPLRSLWPVE